MSTGNPQRVLVLGGTGFVGRELGQQLAMQGHKVVLVARHPDRVRGILPFPCELHAWADVNQPIPPAALAGCDAVVNLIGEGIADKPWTKARRQQLLQSRAASVAALSAALRQMPGQRPKVIIQASAIGYFGDRGDEVLTEASQAGKGFLPDVCLAWEAHDLPEVVERVVTLRFGLVLGLTGGALPKLLGIYAKGLGAVLGNGRQWVSWIHIDDLVAMIMTAVTDRRWQGHFNGTAPEPCPFKDFNAALAEHGRYSANKTVPAPVLRLAMGGRAALVLDSTRVLPAAAERLGFKFKFQTIGAAFAHLLGDAVGSGMRRLVTRQWVPQPPVEIWPFFTEAKNLTRLTPDWLGFKVKGMSTANIGEGTRINYTISLRGVPMRWQSLIKNWQPGTLFVDEQIRGPYNVWHHSHGFEALAGGTLMTDDVQYRLPLKSLGELTAGLFVERDVARIFAFRRQAIADMWSP